MTKTKTPKIPVLNITPSLLKFFGACPEGIAKFKKAYPKGIKATVPPSEADINMMHGAGLDVRGFISLVPLKIPVDRQDLLRMISGKVEDWLYQSGRDAQLQNLLYEGQKQIKAIMRQRNTVNVFNALMAWQASQKPVAKVKAAVKAVGKLAKRIVKGKR